MATSSPGGIGKYLGLALMLPIATCVGYALGYGLDTLFHTYVDTVAVPRFRIGRGDHGSDV